MDDQRVFRGLLNAVLRRVFLDDQTLTPEVTKQELGLEQCTVEEVATMMETCKGILAKAASEDLSLTEVETYAKSQGLSEAQTALIVRFWKIQKEKIHTIVRQKSIWNDTVPRVSWRIDVQSRTRTSTEEINIPSAIFEIEIDSKAFADKKQEKKIVRFEMNRQQLTTTLHQLEAIQKAIDIASQK